MWGGDYGMEGVVVRVGREAWRYESLELWEEAIAWKQNHRQSQHEIRC
jgi:hypothetical protein